jgi:hypothetical protein
MSTRLTSLILLSGIVYFMSGCGPASETDSSSPQSMPTASPPASADGQPQSAGDDGNEPSASDEKPVPLDVPPPDDP